MMLCFFASWSRSDLIALYSLAAGVVGITIAIWTLHRGNLNASVATMIPLNAEIRTVFEDYLDSFHNVSFTTYEELQAVSLRIKLKLERLLNVLEIAAAILQENSLSGVSNLLMRDYLERVLNTLLADDRTRSAFADMIRVPGTYACIQGFLDKVATKKSHSPAATTA
jgi:predicted Zn-dependent peptidase